MQFSFLGNLSRVFTFFPSNGVSRHHRAAQALLTLASPSTQVAYPRSYPPSKLTNYTLPYPSVLLSKKKLKINTRPYSGRQNRLLGNAV
jgi:hypothetical protein